MVTMVTTTIAIITIAIITIAIITTMNLLVLGQQQRN
jgi:hypothetical protein